ncbi:MAG: ATP-dependent zinc metalloprotease FtsH [Clostridiaceae bacterium]|nr:ATP-dependent zinc metalloprotease FtsH [Clostridiaceae bacterium]
MKKINWKALIPYVVIPLAFIVCIAYYSTMGGKTQAKTEYYQILNLFEENKVASYDLNLSSGVLRYKLRDGDTVYKYTVPNVTLFLEDVHDDVVKFNKQNPDSQIKIDYESGSANSWWVSLLPTLAIVVLLTVVMTIMFRKMNQTVQSENNRTMSFGKARFKKNEDNKNKKTFADVAGADEEKADLEEIVEFLKDPKQFTALGARIPKGVLLVGPPGTGKTLLAKAVAGEADVPFFSISGSDFVEMYVGVGASRVRDLFGEAKKSAPSIIFIDEIDAVGRHRGAGMGGGHDEREQTLNQMLVEMDGFGENEGVIVMAATNRPDILDPALLRPGRFDRQITVNYPDVKGREEILKVHAKKKPLGPDVVLKNIAGATVGFTGADLENLLNEAALLAARRKLKAITMKEIEEATMKVVVGTEKKSHKVSQRDKEITAYHEAGHAVSSYYLEHKDPVTHISIVPRGMAGGFTMYQPEKDEMHLMKSRMLDDIVGLLGGRVAEKIIFDDISTGASNDIERATDIARKMVTKYGMSEKLGPINFGTENDEVFIGRDYNHMRNYSESVAASIDAEIEEIVLNAYKRTESILRDHIDQLHKVAKELVKREKITGEEFETLMQGGELPEIEEEKPEQQEKLKDIIDNAVSDADGEEAPKPEIADGADTPTLPEEKQDSDK